MIYCFLDVYSLTERPPFYLYFLSFDIASEIIPPLNGHSGQMTRTDHFLVALSSLLDSFFPSSVGSIILAISCPG